MFRTGQPARRRDSSEREDRMSDITLNDIREALADEKIIIKHNGIDIFMECKETNEKLIIPMVHATVDNRNSRVERVFGAKETWSTTSAPNPDEGQGPYKGFLLVVCEECGEIKAFCAKRETYSFRCDKCGHETALENLRPMYMHCKCGKSFRYKTNAESETITHTCLDCKAPVDMELNKKGTAYVTIGVRGGKAR